MNRLEELRKEEQREYLLQKKKEDDEIIIVKPEKPDENKPQKTHPDGEWGWVVVSAAFMTQFIVVGLQNSSGVIFDELVTKFDESRGKTGFVSSISCGMMFLLGPVSTALCQRFGCRKIGIFGGFLCCIGLGFSAHASTLQIMYITFGLTWGLGTSFCYFPTLIILVPYFNKRLALVNGIVSAGAGVGTLILSPSIQWFAKQFGMKSMFYGLAFLHSFVVLAAFVYRPLSDEYKIRQGIEVKEKPKILDNIPQRQYTKETLLSRDSRSHLEPRMKEGRSRVEVAEEYNGDDMEESTFKETMVVLSELFKDKSFVAWCFGLSIFMMGYFVPFLHLGPYAKLIGIKDVNAAFLISIVAIISTIFKILSGQLAGLQHINTMKLYQFGLLIMGVSTTLVPVSRTYAGLCFYSIAFGIGESCFIVMIPLITKDIVGVQRLPLALGCVFMLMGIPTLFGTPIAGWIYDASQDYSYVFFAAGMMNIIGVLIMFLITFFRQEGNLRKKVMEERMRYREDNEKQAAASKTIVMTSFTSTERIYISQRDLANPFDDSIIKRRRPQLSKIIEFTSLASSERIYLSSRDTLTDPYPAFDDNSLNRNSKDSPSKALPPASFPTLHINVRYNRPESIAFGDHFKFDLEANQQQKSKRPLSLQFEPRNFRNSLFLAPLAESEKEYEDFPDGSGDSGEERPASPAIESHSWTESPEIKNNIRPESPGIEINTINPASNPASPAISTKMNKKSSRITHHNNHHKNRNVVIKWWTSIFKKSFPQTSDRAVTVLDEKLFVDSRLTVV